MRIHTSLLLPIALLLIIQTGSAQSWEYRTALPNLPGNLAASARVYLLLTPERNGSASITLLPGGSTQSFDFLEGVPTTAEIPLSSISVETAAEGRSDRSVVLTSTERLTVNAYLDAPYFSEAWVVPPTTRLGTRYRVISRPDSANTFGPFALVIASRDATTVRVTPSMATEGGNSPGFSYSVVLEAGESYQVLAKDFRRGDLSGTLITSDAPIYLLSGHRGARIDSSTDATNPLIEQMLPVEEWGHSYLGYPILSRPSRPHRAVADPSSTIFTEEGETWAIPPSSGTDILLTDPHRLQSADLVSLASYMTRLPADPSATTEELSLSGDPSMTIMLPIGTWQTEYRWAVPDLPDRILSGRPDSTIPFTNFVIVTAPLDATLRLNGTDISGSMTPIDSRFGTLTREISTGSHELISTLPIEVQIAGTSFHDAWSAPASFGLAQPLRARPLIDSGCAETEHVALRITNPSSADVIVDSVSTIGIDAVILTPSVPFTIPAEGSLDLSIEIRALDPGSTAGWLRFHNLDSVNTADLFLPVDFERVSTSLRFDPEGIAFPPTSLFDSRDTLVLLINDGNWPVDIQDVSLPSGWSIVGSALPETLAPGDSARLMLRYRPTSTADTGGIARAVVAACDPVATIALSSRVLDSGDLQVRSVGSGSVGCGVAADTIDVRLENAGDAAVDVVAILFEGSPSFRFIGGGLPVSVGRGASITLAVEYRPAADGLATVSMGIVTSDGDTIRVTLEGLRQRPELIITPESVELGRIPACQLPVSRTISLRNGGDDSLPIDEIRLSSSSWLNAGSASLTIPPGDSASLSILFLGPGSAVGQDTLFLISSACGSIDTLLLRGEAVRPIIDPVQEEIDFGIVAACDVGQVRYARFVNNGSEADTLLRLELEHFRVPDIEQEILLPGDTLSIPIRMPETLGQFYDTLTATFNPCGIERRIVLSGTVVRLVGGFESPFDFGPLYADQGLTVTTSLRNDSPLEITVDQLISGTAGSAIEVVSPATPFTIPPASAVGVTLRYRNALPEAFDEILRAEISSPCDTVWTTSIIGRERPIDLIFSLPDTSADVDRRVEIPLLVESSEEIGTEIQIGGEIAWNPRNLLLVSVRPDDPAASFEITPAPGPYAGVGEVRFTYTGNEPSQEAIAWMTFDVLLPREISSPLDLTVSRVASGAPAFPVRWTVLDGIFLTTGICTIGDDARLIRFPAQLKPYRPDLE